LRARDGVAKFRSKLTPCGRQLRAPGVGQEGGDAKTSTVILSGIGFFFHGRVYSIWNDMAMPIRNILVI